MESSGVVEAEAYFRFPSGLLSVRVGFQVNLLVLQRLPQPLHEDVVVVPALPVNTDFTSERLALLFGLGNLLTAEGQLSG